jgi:hypothetical protein
MECKPQVIVSIYIVWIQFEDLFINLYCLEKVITFEILIPKGCKGNGVIRVVLEGVFTVPSRGREIIKMPNPNTTAKRIIIIQFLKFPEAILNNTCF